MDFAITAELAEDLEQFKAFLRAHMEPHLAEWYRQEAIPREFLGRMGHSGWLGYSQEDGRIIEQSALRQAILLENLAKVSPGVAVAVLVQTSLGAAPLFLFGSEAQKQLVLLSALNGSTLLCLGNTEHKAGSDVASITMQAENVEGGWVLKGAKAYVTSGAISDLALVTAVTDPGASRNRRLSMFLVDLSSTGVSRKRLSKQVWIPSDLTRLSFDNVFVPEENLVGERGRGLQQVLATFTHSRIPMSGLTLGTAVGAFEMGLDRQDLL